MLNVGFKLETPHGSVSYYPGENSNYTEFVQITIELLLAHNAKELDEEFVQFMQDALEAYKNGETLGELGNEFAEDGISEEEEEEEAVETALRTLKEKDKELVSINKVIQDIPPAKNLELQILSIDEDQIKASNITKYLSKVLNVSEETAKLYSQKSKSFTLPFEEGIKLYTDLRVWGVVLRKPISMDDVKTEVKKPFTAVLSGKEKINKEHAIIK